MTSSSMVLKGVACAFDSPSRATSSSAGGARVLSSSCDCTTPRTQPGGTDTRTVLGIVMLLPGALFVRDGVGPLSHDGAPPWASLLVSAGNCSGLRETLGRERSLPTAFGAIGMRCPPERKPSSTRKAAVGTLKKLKETKECLRTQMGEAPGLRRQAGSADTRSGSTRQQSAGARMAIEPLAGDRRMTRFRVSNQPFPIAIFVLVGIAAVSGCSSGKGIVTRTDSSVPTDGKQDVAGPTFDGGPVVDVALERPIGWIEAGTSLPDGTSFTNDGIGSPDVAVAEIDSGQDQPGDPSFDTTNSHDSNTGIANDANAAPDVPIPSDSATTPIDGSTVDGPTSVDSGGADGGGGAIGTVDAALDTDDREAVQGASAPTGSMAVARAGHTATLLQNGMVLIAGGSIGSGSTATAELYDPAAGIFTATGSMTTARVFHTATLLPNGMVLVAGGRTTMAAASGINIATAELYDPAAGTFTATNSMSVPRSEHTATLLRNGKVLIAGGNASVTTSNVSAELYNPVAGTFAATGSMTVAREQHTATLLSSGAVLITGGCTNFANGSLPSCYESGIAELYDAAIGTFAATGSMTVSRSRHTATLLQDGTVLVAGRPSANANASAEAYDPSARSFTATGSMTAARYSHTATLLSDGKVLVAGGASVGVKALVGTELYDAKAGVFAAARDMTVARVDHAATLLTNGKVLITGGLDGKLNPLASAELYE